VLDAAGNATRAVRGANGQDTTFITYDALNRPTQRITSAGQVPSPQCHPLVQSVAPDDCSSLPLFPYVRAPIPADTATFTYDAVGNMLTAYNGDARIRRSYYPNGALKTDSIWIREYSSGSFSTHAYGLSYEYDLSGRRTVLGLATNLGTGCTLGQQSTCKQTYHYDADHGGLDTLTSVFGHKYTFSYDAKGRITGRSAPGGVSEAWTYDLDDRAVTRLEQRNGSTVVHADTIRRDARGKVIDLKYGGLTAGRSRFAYSVLGHLIASERIGPPRATPSPRSGCWTPRPTSPRTTATRTSPRPCRKRARTKAMS
jgi:YD repeat-containing protein